MPYNELRRFINENLLMEKLFKFDSLLRSMRPTRLKYFQDGGNNQENSQEEME